MENKSIYFYNKLSQRKINLTEIMNEGSAMENITKYCIGAAASYTNISNRKFSQYSKPSI